MTQPARSIPTLSQLRRKTVVGLLRAWREVESTARHIIKHEVQADVLREDIDFLRGRMKLCLDSHGGEISERAQTAELGRIYLNLSETGRARFLKLLAAEFDVNRGIVERLAQAYANSSMPERIKIEPKLREALTSPRATILKQFTALPDGFKFLVDLRADLLPLAAKDPGLKGLESDLKDILGSWFDVGLLDLVEITWKSPAALLEKLIAYEAVHKISSWEDLKNRLDADRRVFAFFHPKMPQEPLIFVHVALVEGMSDNIQKLLDEKSPVFNVKKADTAIFYSISNAQKGLAGISFGNFLIKRVVSQLTQEMPQITTFATLSPIPGFCDWLAQSKHSGALKEMQGEWWKSKARADALKPILLRLCAHYLLKEKKGEKPLDPVAAFHLFNGARLERLNWLGDISAKGMKQSAGLMANYYYKLSEIDDNHEEFAAHGKIVAGRQVRGYVE